LSPSREGGTHDDRRKRVLSRSRHTEAQMIAALKQVEAGRAVEDVAGEVGVSKVFGEINWRSAAPYRHDVCRSRAVQPIRVGLHKNSFLLENAGRHGSGSEGWR
jgi:hypothetical protein